MKKWKYEHWINATVATSALAAALIIVGFITRGMAQLYVGLAAAVATGLACVFKVIGDRKLDSLIEE